MLTQEVETATNLIKKMQIDKDEVEIKYSKQRQETIQVEKQLNQLSGKIQEVELAAQLQIEAIKEDFLADK